MHNAYLPVNDITMPNAFIPVLGVAIMSDKATRLREARKAAGFSSARSAAETRGFPVSTYAQHENGIRGYDDELAKAYARAFRVTPEWLLFGKGKPQRGHLLPDEFELEAILRDVQGEIPASTPFSDWPRVAAAALLARLELYQEDRQQ